MSESSSKILVAHADPGVRKLISEVLRIDGYPADVVENADRALQHLLKNRYSLLIADIAMPGTSGLKLAHEVRDRQLRVPILLIAGEPDPAMLDLAVLNLGRAQYLEKPFEIAELRSAIRHLLAMPERDRSEPPRRLTNC
jgi:two-component system alkaline phosphatase synthesis response regulator PhoP